MNIGITGGIGSGKSYVCKKLVELGFPVYSCDDEAKLLMLHDSSVVDGIKKLVGDGAYTPVGDINKKVIADFIFSAPEHLNRMNAIVHPCVKAYFESWARTRDTDFVFMECAILFESGFNEVVDKTVSVYAPKEVRLMRAMLRDHATEGQVIDRMNNQMDEEAKRSLADFVILNDGVADVDEQIRNMLDCFSLADRI
ncbi:MAG: dephospho-CoA kinase [Prevotellaceae bacterium]|nr:dephospho-CoA kinase [Prevotellaceae bacterium]